MSFNGHVLWLTGLSGSGKSTLAKELQSRLQDHGWRTLIVDGDEVRKKFPNRGFSPEDRFSHNESIVNDLMQKENFDIILVATIAPFKKIRQHSRQRIPNYHEIYISTPLEICKERDPKGLYEKVAQGEIKNFTGIDQPYERPTQPELELDTSDETVDQSTTKLLKYIEPFLKKGAHV